MTLDDKLMDLKNSTYDSKTESVLLNGILQNYIKKNPCVEITEDQWCILISLSSDDNLFHKYRFIWDILFLYYNNDLSPISITNLERALIKSEKFCIEKQDIALITYLKNKDVRIQLHNYEDDFISYRDYPIITGKTIFLIIAIVGLLYIIYCVLMKQEQ